MFFTQINNFKLEFQGFQLDLKRWPERLDKSWHLQNRSCAEGFRALIYALGLFLRFLDGRNALISFLKSCAEGFRALISALGLFLRFLDGRNALISFLKN